MKRCTQRISSSRVIGRPHDTVVINKWPYEVTRGKQKHNHNNIRQTHEPGLKRWHTSRRGLEAQLAPSPLPGFGTDPRTTMARGTQSSSTVDRPDSPKTAPRTFSHKQYILVVARAWFLGPRQTRPRPCSVPSFKWICPKHPPSSTH
jgi:hypothetical protein